MMIDDLHEYQSRDEDTLLALGFRREEEETADVVRWAYYQRKLATTFDASYGHTEREPPNYELRLRIRFELCVADNPHAKGLDNFNYGFEGIFLQVIDENGVPLTEFEAHVSTLAGLRNIIAAFNRQ